MSAAAAASWSDDTHPDEVNEEEEAVKMFPFAVSFRSEYARLVDEDYRKAESEVTERPLAETNGEEAVAKRTVFRVNPCYDREATRPGFCRYNDVPLSVQLGVDGRIVAPNHVFNPVLLHRKQKTVVLEFVYPEYTQKLLQFVQAHSIGTGVYRPVEMRIGAAELNDHLMKQLSASVRNKDGYHILPTHIEIASFDSNIPAFGDIHLLSTTPTHSLRPFKYCVDYQRATGEVVKMHDWCSSPGVRNGGGGVKTGMVLAPCGKGSNYVLYSPSDELNSKDVLIHMNSRMDCVLQQYKSAASNDRKKKHNLVLRLDMPSDTAPKSSYTPLQRFVMYNKPELVTLTDQYLHENNITTITVPLNIPHIGAAGEIGMYVVDRVLGKLIEDRMDQASPERFCMNCRELTLVCHFDWDKLARIAETVNQAPYLRAQVLIAYQEYDDKEADEAMKFQQMHKTGSQRGL